MVNKAVGIVATGLELYLIRAMPSLVACPIFENEMNRLEFGEISAPFRSQYGFHIVQVLDRRERDNTEESLRLRAENYLKSQKAQQEIESWLRRLPNESYVEYLFLQDNPSG